MDVSERIERAVLNVATITGGEKLKAKLRELSQVAKPATLRVGFLEGATYPDGTSVPMVAAIQEFGAPARGIPPRPFFRNMVAAHKAEWGSAITAKFQETGSVDVTLRAMGEGIKIQLQQSIIDTNDPPLSPVTVMLRGMRANNPDLKVTGKTVGEAAARVKAGKTNYGASTKALIDTGALYAAVDYEVSSS